MFENTYTDIELTCADCGATFVFTAEEQEFYNEKGFSTPKRCPECRNARKRQRRNGRNGGAKKRYDVICSKCGCETTVPFRPREDKPVYCSECFAKIQEEQQQQENNIGSVG